MAYGLPSLSFLSIGTWLARPKDVWNDTWLNVMRVFEIEKDLNIREDNTAWQNRKLAKREASKD